METLHTNVHQMMCARLQDADQTRRDEAKTAVMTSLYGSKAMPRPIFGEGARLETFYAVMQEELPGIWELNEALLDL